MINWMKGKLAAVSHRACYAGLALCHLFAAWATGKWAVYLPMAVFYGLLAARG